MTDPSLVSPCSFFLIRHSRFGIFALGMVIGLLTCGFSLRDHSDLSGPRFNHAHDKRAIENP